MNRPPSLRIGRKAAFKLHLIAGIALFILGALAILVGAYAQAIKGIEFGLVPLVLGFGCLLGAFDLAPSKGSSDGN